MVRRDAQQSQLQREKKSAVWPRDNLIAKEQRNGNTSRVFAPRPCQIDSERSHQRM
jgi:hypothetical protein